MVSRRPGAQGKSKKNGDGPGRGLALAPPPYMQPRVVAWRHPALLGRDFCTHGPGSELPIEANPSRSFAGEPSTFLFTA